MKPTVVKLPAGVRSGHLAPEIVAEIQAAGFGVNHRLGQLVEVRCPAGHLHLLVEEDGQWTLHRRVTPDANGHERNRTHAEAAHCIPKKVADDGR